MMIASAATPVAAPTLLDRVLSLRDLSSAGEGVSFQFAHEVPGWAWVLAVCACVGVGVWSYSRLQAPRAARVGLGVLRACTLLALLVLILGPRFSKQEERTERDSVILLADRSGSMRVVESDTRDSREDQLQRALRDAAPSFAALKEQRDLLALGFDTGVFELAMPPSAAPTSTSPPSSQVVLAGSPTNGRTALGASLAQALKRVPVRPVAGVVLLSDGRSFDQPTRETMQELKDRRIPVFPFALGSATPSPDIAITRVEAPQAAFIEDTIPVSVELVGLGTGTLSGQSGKVELLGPQGEVLDTRTFVGEGATQTLTLMARAKDKGAQQWSVRVTPDASDLSQENNQRTLRLELVDNPIRVVQMDGYPRWEYRYLKNLVLREAGLRSSNLLLASDRRYIQEGTDKLASLPRTAAEWSPFDVVILGDVRPSVFTQEQLEGLRAHVAQRGGGLLLIGGAAFTPGAWSATPMGDLLPINVSAGESGSGGGAGVRAWTQPVIMQRGPAADAYGVLRLGDDQSQPWPEALTDPALKWSALRWSQRVDPLGLKPATEVLALARDVRADDTLGDAWPLVVTMRYGAGRIVYVATDETWRYRYARGETLTERFWIPIIRLLARGSLGRTGQPAIIEASPEEVGSRQPVRVTLRLLDQSLIERKQAQVVARVTRDGAAEDGLTLTPQGTPEPGASVATYVATWVPSKPGEYAIEVDDPLLAGLGLAARVHVTLPEDELRTPQADHAALAALAQATGGRMLTQADLPKLAEILPNRQERVLGTPEIETLWDKPIALATLLVLLGAEWIGRRLVRLA